VTVVLELQPRDNNRLKVVVGILATLFILYLTY
jgi:hypothetical protein